MKWYCELYLSERLCERKAEIQSQLEAGEYKKSSMYLVLPLEPIGQLELIRGIYLEQSYYRKRDLLIVGIAETKRDALGIVEQMTKEVYDGTGYTRLREYLLQKQKEYEERKV